MDIDDAESSRRLRLEVSPLFTLFPLIGSVVDVVHFTRTLKYGGVQPFVLKLHWLPPIAVDLLLISLPATLPALFWSSWPNITSGYKLEDPPSPIKVFDPTYITLSKNEFGNFRMR
jgi:hypothetical protein